MSSVFANLAAGAAAVLLRLLPRLSAGERSWIARKLVRDRFSPEARAFAGFCTQAVHAWKNKQYDIRQNGEEALLKRLAPFRPAVLFDVGANEGEWSIAACTHLAGAQVHAFEIARETAAILRQRTTAFGNRIVINESGLLDRSGSIAIHRIVSDSTGTSTLDMAVHYDAHRPDDIVVEQAEVVSGDAYMETHGIARIDLLKIDVEGAEEAVLRGFARAFAEQRITLVQFEYGWLNAHNGFRLKDAYALFEQHGFLLGKLYPEGVAFKPYTYADEDFLGPNYVACHSSRDDIVEHLRCPAL